MTIVVNQPFGIGDVIFCQTLVRRIADGRQIAWPVFPQFVEGLRRAYPNILWLDYKAVNIDYERRDQYEIEMPNWGTCTVLPLRHNVEIMKVPYSQCMSSKYEMYGMDWRDWKELAMWKVDPFKPMPLALAAGVPTGKEYTLVNRIFGSDSQLRADIPVEGVEMKTFDGCSLFDWTRIIQNASAIHTVSTSIIYLLEMLDLKAPEVHLYVRKPLETDFRNVDYLLQKHKYILHL